MKDSMRALRRFTQIAGCVLLAGSGSSAVAQTMYYPKPQLVDYTTGFMESLAGGYWYRGSAVITRDPKLIYSCAHLFYEEGEWAVDYNFYRAYNAKFYPNGTGTSPRGLHYFTSYSSAVNSYGQNSDQAFASDFTVLYSNYAFGSTAADWWPQGGSALRSTRAKRIVGYPSHVDYTGQSGYCYQHATDWFGNDAYKVLGGFHEFQDVSTGPGNSGGPVFVHDSETGRDRLAGILVSGSSRTAGVIALDLSTHTLAGYALGLKDKTLTFSDTTSRSLPDGATYYTGVPIRVSGFTGTTQKLSLSLNITTPRRGDLNVYLKSPNGRIRWIAKQSADSTDNLVLSGENLTRWFGGYNPNGKWQIYARDGVRNARAVFKSASLTISAL